MIKRVKPPAENELRTTLADFLKTYNQSIPDSFPHASTALLHKFKEHNAAFFKHGDFWSLDQHRKKVMDWLPLNSNL